MSTVSSRIPGSTLRRDLGLVGWQIRYEQRSYWRNRGRGVFTFAFPIMFLVIFASLDKGQHISNRGGIPYNDFFVPGILAYGVITTTFLNLAISTAILRDEGVLKRMQGTPLPRWAYVRGADRLDVPDHDGDGDRRDRTRRRRLGAELPGRRAARPDRDTAAGNGRLHGDRDRDHPFHPQRRGGAGRRQPGRAAADLHLQHLVPDRFDLPTALKDIAGVFPIKALASGLQYVFDPRHGGAGFSGSDLRTLAIWTVVGVVLMLRFLRQPQGEVA